MAALPVLEQIRVLCSDIERRRLAVANVVAATSNNNNNNSSNNHTATTTSSNKNNNNDNNALHANVMLIKDQFTLRQAKAVRDASDQVLDALDSTDMTNLVQLFVASRMALINSNNNNNKSSQQQQQQQYNPQIIAQRALETFDVSAAHLREYHRSYSQKPFELPQLERPNEQDIHQVRAKLFTGPERKGKSIDLTTSYKYFCDFQSQSSLEMAKQQQAASNIAITTTIVDQEVTYVEYVRDPIASIGKAISAKRKIEYAHLYAPCLQAAALSLESYTTKTRPLTAGAEIRETRERVSTLMKNVRQNIFGNGNSSNHNNNNITTIISDQFSERVKEAWKKFNFEKNMPIASTLEISNQHRMSLLKILQLEEHISLLCSSVVGDHLLFASADHIARSALRSTQEEAQDEDDDELRFQQDFFTSFYAQTPLSDRLGFTLSESGHAVAAGMSQLKKIQDQILEEDAAKKNQNGMSFDGENAEENEQNPDDDMTPEERARLANPKNFPLDAEGKPIPVWLYKLHQLDKKFFCEICGHAYPGEKIFTQHFGEPVHERGLARIGIVITPMNSPHFRLISTREGALATQRRLLEGEENTKRRLRGEDDEEEDGHGNVVTRAQLIQTAAASALAQQQQQQLRQQQGNYYRGY